MAEIEAAESAGVRWSPPARLPTAAELLQAIEGLTVKPVTSKHAAQCLARLMLAFEAGTSKLSDEETYQRAKVWREANGDLGNELWSEATLWCLRHHTFGMPRPSQFRAAVADTFAARQRKLDRCRKLLAFVEQARAASRAREDEAREKHGRETELLRTGTPAQRNGIRARRLRDVIAANLKYGMADRAQANQARLDDLERQHKTEGEGR